MSGKKKPKEAVVQTAKLEGVEDLCLDDSGQPAFLILGENKQVEVLQTIQRNGITYTPPHLSAMPWKLPRASEVIRYYSTDSDEAVVEAVREKLHANVELPNPFLYSFVAAWVTQTYLIPQVKYFPILILYSDAERGKSRLGKLIANMSRCGEITESLNPANIFRKAERFCAMLFFDVLDVWKKAEKKDCEDILLSRFERGHVVTRVLNPELRGFEDTSHFSVFGPTVIATNESVNHFLESRAVVISMEKSERNFPDLPGSTELLEIKERLTALQIRWSGRGLPAIEKPCQHRLGDILKPIKQVYIAFMSGFISEFDALLEQFERAGRESKSDSPNGQLLQAIINLKAKPSSDDELCIDKLVEAINQNRPHRYPTTAVAVGKRLASLGIGKGRQGNKRVVFYDEVLMGRLAHQYGLIIPKREESGKLGAYGIHDAGNPGHYFTSPCTPPPPGFYAERSREIAERIDEIFADETSVAPAQEDKTNE